MFHTISTKRSLIFIVMFIFASIGVYLAMSSSAAITFVKVADHPAAVLQSTAYGKTIHTLKVLNNNIYAGYGDYTANTGPISLMPFDGTSFAPSEYAVDTEAIYVYRELLGKYYAVSADPRASADFAVGTLLGGRISWENRTPVGSIHMYDIFTLSGTDLWLVGAKGSNAMVWRSLDNGLTWQASLSVPPKVSTDFARFYGAIVHGGKIYVQGYDNSGGRHLLSKVFDGTQWVDGPDIGLFNSVSTFAGKPVMHSNTHVGYSGSIRTFNGSVSTSFASPAYNYTISGNTLFVLMTTGEVRKTTDFVNWISVGTTSTLTRSIAVLNGVIYLGATDGAIYKLADSNTPPPPADTTPPSVSLTAPTSGLSATVGSTITLSASATDNVGVARVEFYSGATGSAPTLIGSDTTSPYSISWDTTSQAAGSKSLTARAYDTASNTSTSVATPMTLTLPVTGSGDTNGDGRVNAIDLSVMLSRDGQNYPPADFNGDGTVGAADLAILLSKWTW